MLRGLLATLLISLAVTINKKGVEYKGKLKLSNLGYELIGEVILFVFLLALVAMVPFVDFLHFDFGNFTLVVVLTIVLWKLISLVSINLYYNIFQKEKLSKILPLNNFDKFFTIILGFFLFQNTSITTVVFALLAAAILTLSQIDFGHREVSPYMGLFILIGMIRTVGQLLTGYLLTWLSAFELLIAGTLFAGVLMCIYLMKTKEIYRLKSKASRRILHLRSYDKILVIVSTLISYSLIQELGVVSALLIGFIGYFSRLLFAFIVLKEKPEIKEIVVGIAIMVCIFLGTYLG